ncbi:MAG TPA: hypothetical protein VIJ46_07295, partial [Rhabdochlamydiaceae bacterium]
MSGLIGYASDAFFGGCSFVGRSMYGAYIWSGLGTLPQATLCTGHVISGRDYAAATLRIRQLQPGDSLHILERSINPEYTIPEPVVLRLQELKILSDGKLDPLIVQVAEATEISSFQLFGGNDTAAAAAKLFQREIKTEVDAQRIVELESITTYAQLAAYKSTHSTEK